MDPFDSIKRRLDGFLPQNHRWLLVALAASLIIFSHEGDYEDRMLVSRHAISPDLTDPAFTNVQPDSKQEAAGGLEQVSSLIPLKPAMNQLALEEDLEPRPDPVEQERAPQFVSEVKPGDNLSLIFARVGLTAQDVYQVSHNKPKSSVITNLFPGYIMEFYLDSEQQLENFIVKKNKLESTVFTRNEEGDFIASEVVLEPEIRQVFREATIDDSMFLAAQRGGISASITMELAGIFGGVIDFLLDTRQGDTFNLLYEEKYLDDEYIGNGAILAAQFTNQGETYTAVRYLNLAGDTDFYNALGESMRKAFLRNPLDFTRISSGFSLSRKHPILNTIRAHKGTDYAAPRGTPVVATADGRVTWAARNGSFGKLVVVQHGDRFQTKYAHLSEYARGVKNGARIKQGQVIGYVGSTGSATGPHLHFEFLMDGVHRNSRTIHDQLPKAVSVADNELLRFQEHTRGLLAQLESNASNTQNIALSTATVETQQ